MDFLTYKLIHIIGVVVLLVSLGAMLGAGKSIKVGAIGHGIGLVLILVSGFGMQAKGGFGFPGWMIAKVAVWLLLGAVMVLIKRKVMPVSNVAVIILVLATASAWLALYKPF